MELSVISDPSGQGDVPGHETTVDTPRPAPAPERPVRRFAFDPASSPVLMAAFAWDVAGPVR